MPSNRHGAGSPKEMDGAERSDCDGIGGRSTGSDDVTGPVDTVGAVDAGGVADAVGLGTARNDSRVPSGRETDGSERWARVLSSVTPAAMVAAVGIRVGSAGRRFAPEVAARLDGVPVGVDAGILSAVAGTVHGLSVLLAIGVACAIGWLVLSATVRLATSATR
ncbi:hypothetical protein DQW50_07105 [Halorubrum sp. 48-1-W]|uniref:hypothetical protein n=1 Tax=Halorubrum sp. 48-1-W TaxID=2249761 RepID=UPI000DCB26AE|nr:hypothetical protein [Halorubrum sp. 48-1-W]RAW45776.1 hypothetical protein DQW50_07105 [Halorubrum sp. 48-1-W]